MDIHVSILPNPLPSRLQHNIKKSSMCSTTGPCWLSILNTVGVHRVAQSWTRLKRLSSSSVYKSRAFFLMKIQQKEVPCNAMPVSTSTFLLVFLLQLITCLINCLQMILIFTLYNIVSFKIVLQGIEIIIFYTEKNLKHDPCFSFPVLTLADFQPLGTSISSYASFLYKMQR